MPLYVADYLADTGHLSTVEHGAYMLLIMHYWQTGSLPEDDKRLSRIARLNEAEWQDVRDTLADMFDANWKHKRIDAEIAKVADISTKRKAAASQARSKSNANATANAPSNDDQLQTHSHSHSQDTAGASARDLRDRLVDAMGPLGWCANRYSKFHVLSDPAHWLSSGCDLEADILPAVRAKCLAMQQRGDEPKGWRIFAEDVFKARDHRLAPPPPVQARAADPPGRRPARESAMAILREVEPDAARRQIPSYRTDA